MDLPKPRKRIEEQWLLLAKGFPKTIAADEISRARMIFFAGAISVEDLYRSMTEVSGTEGRLMLADFLAELSGFKADISRQMHEALSQLLTDILTKRGQGDGAKH